MAVKGYHDCPCRDCFEIAIGGALDADGEESETEPALCHACEDAGCSATGDEECACEPEPEDDSCLVSTEADKRCKDCGKTFYHFAGGTSFCKC